MTKKEKMIHLFLPFMILGMLAASQFKTTLMVNQQKSKAALNIENLTQQIEYQTMLNKQLKKQLEEQAKINNQLLKQFLQGDDVSIDLLKQLEWVRFIGNLTDVQGPGIQITLDDALAREGDPRYLMIHDSDIKKILNELKKSGAQAISINGERIVPMSEQICAGPTILINRTRYSVPYVISAIGNADHMFETISNSDFITVLRYDKIRIDIKKLDSIVIPKFNYDVHKITKLISFLEEDKK